MRKTIGAILIAFPILLTACQGDDPAANPPPEFALPAENGSPEPQSAARITRELTDGVFVDAEIAPLSGNSFPVFAVEPNSYSPELLDELFLAGDDSVREFQQSDWDPAGFQLTTLNGSSVYSADGNVDYYGTAYSMDAAQVMKDYAETAEQSGGSGGLPFISEDEAVAAALLLFERLDVFGEPELNTFIAMDHKTIWEHQQTMMARDDMYSYFVSIGKTVSLDSLTESDDACYLRFSFRHGTLPLFNAEIEKPIVSSSGGFQPYSVRAEMLLTRDGLRLFSMIGSFSGSGEDNEPEIIIDTDALLERIEEKYSLQIMTESLIFTRIFLEYLPVRTELNFEAGAKSALIPYWCAEYSLTNSDGAMYAAGAERFNAITGEDFAYGG
jgi:hypothetical protein